MKRDSGFMGNRGIGKYIAGCVGLLAMMGATGCGAKEEGAVAKKVAVAEEKVESVDDIVRNYLMSESIRYVREVKDSDNEADSVIVYDTGQIFNNQLVTIKVFIYPGKEVYHLGGVMPDIGVSAENIPYAMAALNYYNLHSTITSGMIYDNGLIAFDVSRNYDGHSYSKEGFAADFEVVYDAITKSSKIIYDIATDWANRSYGENVVRLQSKLNDIEESE